MRLLIAWVVSALAGFVTYAIAALALEAIPMYARGPHLIGLFVPMTTYLHAAAIPLTLQLLALQLTYGGLVYLVLSWLGLFNLPLVLLAYMAPIGGLLLMRAAAPGHTYAIPTLAAVATLAVVGWRLARPPAT